MNFVRSRIAPRMDCRPGPGEQVDIFTLLSALHIYVSDKYTICQFYTKVTSNVLQVNQLTSWLDASQVYGSDDATADSLREFADGLLLLQSTRSVGSVNMGNKTSLFQEIHL